jgi:hypothetical protein
MAVRFLRDPGVQVGPQQTGVSASNHLSSADELSRLTALLQRIRPTGASTPILYHLQDLVPTVQTMAAKLEEQRRRVVISICTDSIPTDTDGIESPEMVEAFMLTLQQIMIYPVSAVIRLLTDEVRVVQFYENMSRRTNSRLKQVVDDYLSECKQVHKHNPWLHYGYPLHLCREQGIQIPILEALSRQTLSGPEARTAVTIIFNQIEAQEQMSYIEFRKQVAAWNKEVGMSWSPVRKRFVPWVFLKQLDRLYSRDRENVISCNCKSFVCTYYDRKHVPIRMLCDMP